MKTCTIFNEASGTCSRVHSKLMALADESGSMGVRLDRNRPPREQLLAAKRAGCERFIVAGGDGTVSRLLNALGPGMSDVQWAVIPAGTGNDFARSLGIPLACVEDAWKIAWRKYGGD